MHHNHSLTTKHSRIGQLVTRLKAGYAEQISPEIRLVFGWCLLVLAAGCVFQLINVIGRQYPGYSYLSWRWVAMSPLVLGLLYYARTVRKTTPRLALFTETYTVYFFIILVGTILANGIQYTPFNPIDDTLLHLDQALGVSTPGLIKWTALHPAIQHLLVSAYNCLDVEVFLVPLLLPWFNERKRIYQLFVAMLVSYLIGGLIYYFLPTAAPVSVVHSHYFISSVYNTAEKFYHIHHYHLGNVNNPGLIAFPSFHVIWAVILTYTLRGKHAWFYSVLAVNILVVFSTVFLGWHYLLDVIAGILIATFSIALANRLIRLRQENVRGLQTHQ